MNTVPGWKAACSFVAAALALGACGPVPVVQMAGDPGAVASITSANVPLNASVSVGSMNLCVSTPGRATIRSVAVHAPTGDIVVEAFATRPNPFTRGLDGVGNARSSIVDLHLDLDPTAPAIVAETCPVDVTAMPDDVASGLVELVVQVARRSGEAAGGPALDIAYDVDGTSRTSVIPLGIWLCEATCPPEADELFRP